MTTSKRLIALLTPLVLGMLGATGLVAASPPARAVASTTAPHVMLIVEENAAYNAAAGSPYIIGNSKAPYINKTLLPQAASATNWFAVQHVSFNDYVDLVSGSDQSCCSKPYTAHTIADQLTSAGVSWKAYMESMPSACYNGSSTGNYDKGHNPFVSFKTTSTQPLCNNVVPYQTSSGGMLSDLGQASPPSFVWVTPNQCDNMHSLCSPTNNKVLQGDNWLKTNIPAIQQTSWYKNNGVIIITWDESITSDTSGGGMSYTSGGKTVPDSGGHIATLVISASSSGTFASAGDHFGTLRGIQNAYGVPCLLNSCSGHGDLSAAWNTVPATINGTVTNTSSAPLDGVTVTCSCSGTPATTANNGTTDGSYSFTSVRPGTYSLTFSDPGYGTQTQSVTVVSGTNTIPPVQLAAAASVSGTVTDAQLNNAAINGVTVTCSCSATTTTANNGTTDGAYSFSNITPGTYTLTFSDSTLPGYVTQAQTVTLASGSNPPVNASLTEDGSIAGTVTDGSNNPVPGVSVTCSDGTPADCPNAATINPDGTYSFSEVAPTKTYTLTFSAPGYVTQTETTPTVTAGAPATTATSVMLAASPAPTLVHEAFRASSAAGTTLSVPISATSTGNLLVVSAAFETAATPAATIISVTDTAHNAYTRQATCGSTCATRVAADIWSSPGSTGGATSVTVTFSATVSAVVRVYEVRGVSAVDTTATASGSSATPIVTSATSSASEFAVGVIGWGGTGSETVAPGSPWTDDAVVNVAITNFKLNEQASHAILSTTQALTDSSTISSAGWAAAIATFK